MTISTAEDRTMDYGGRSHSKPYGVGVYFLVFQIIYTLFHTPHKFNIRYNSSRALIKIWE